MAKRAVIDTNIWLSALYFAGKPSQIVSLVEDKKLTSVISSFILEEIREKLLLKFNTPVFLSNATISHIKSISKVVSLKGQDFGLRDTDDNKVLETAVVGKCNWIITGDKDLLTVKKYQQIKIVNPGQFLRKS